MYLANTTTLVGFIEESGADTVVFDIQDVGARFYTCIISSPSISKLVCTLADSAFL